MSPFRLTIALILAAGAALAQTQPPGLSNATRVFTDAASMVQTDWTDPAETDRSWQAAIIRVPLPDGGSEQVDMATLLTRYGDGVTRFPTVIYMHGCSGIWDGTHLRLKLLADNGFLAIAPASFARLKYPVSCKVETNQGGLYRDTLRMRWADAGHAMEQARKLPMVDGDRMALMGLSEGGITTATFAPRTPDQHVKARVVEGWTCNSGWSEYEGIMAPADEPVLTLVGRDDPWFQNIWTQGDCTKSLNPSNGSRSVVYTDALSDRHELLNHPGPQAVAIGFLKQHLGPPD